MERSLPPKENNLNNWWNAAKFSQWSNWRGPTTFNMVYSETDKKLSGKEYMILRWNVDRWTNMWVYGWELNIITDPLSQEHGWHTSGSADFPVLLALFGQLKSSWYYDIMSHGFTQFPMILMFVSDPYLMNFMTLIRCLLASVLAVMICFLQLCWRFNTQCFIWSAITHMF